MSTHGWEPSGQEFEYAFPEPDPNLVIDLPDTDDLSDLTSVIQQNRARVIDRLKVGFERVRYPIIDCDPAGVALPRTIERRFPVVRESIIVPLSHNVHGRAVFLRNRPKTNPADTKVDIVTQKFRRKRSRKVLSGLFGPRGRPLGCRHAVFGNQTIGQRMDVESAGFFLAVLYILGEEFQGFFNGAAPSHREMLHCHYWTDEVPILSVANIKQWPFPVQFLETSNLGEGAQWMESTASACGETRIAYDFAFAVREGKFVIAAIPRVRNRKRPLHTLAYDNGDDESWYNDHFSTFGVLEMAGYFVGIRTEDAFDMIRKTPSLYVFCLEELTCGVRPAA